MKKERIDKLIAGSGKLSRKDVAGLISHGNVTLNGRTVKKPFVTLSPKSLCAVGCSRPADSIKILRALC